MLRAAIQSRLFSNAAIYLASNLLNALVPVVLLLVLTRYLTPDEYGEVAMFQTLVAGLMAIVGLNTVGATARKYFDHNASRELPEYIGASMAIMAFSAVAVFVALSLTAPWLSQAIALPTLWIQLSVPVAMAWFVVRLRLVQWQVRESPFRYGALQGGMALANFMTALVLVVHIGVGSVGPMAAQLVATLAAGLVAWWFLGKEKLVAWDRVPKHLPAALAFGLPLVPHVGGAFLLSAVDRFFINKYLGLSQAGVYMAAVQIMLAMKIAFDAFNKAYVPWLYSRLKANRAEDLRNIVRFTYVYCLCCLAVAGLVFWLGPYLIELALDDRYRQAGELVGWLALGNAFHGMYLMVTNFIFYSKKTGWLAVGTLCSGALNVVLMIFLIPELGMKGAAYSFSISMLFLFVTTWAGAQNRHPMPWLTSLKVH